MEIPTLIIQVEDENGSTSVEKGCLMGCLFGVLLLLSVCLLWVMFLFGKAMAGG